MAIEAALAGLDDLYVGHKFFHRRMTRHPSLVSILNEHGHLLFGQPADAAERSEIERLVRLRMTVASHLLSQTLVNAGEQAAPALAPFRNAGEGYTRNPFYTPVRWAGGIGLMVGVDLVYQFDQDTAILWSLVDGKSAEEIATELAGRAATARRDQALFVGHTVRAWQKDGIVERRL
ncbi:hypothetical protein ACIBG7_34005 [Nonomuraea sp. NPDC050328]|uniref:hypothetical protein n=1 Tax=Nonomuraea sp. NPDC050328 TaxID=3364361 RepID=UPI00378F0406